MSKEKVIKRRLPLDCKYECIDKKYISLVDGFGCTCDNCGKLIANIATVRSINGVYNIGFDCLETFLLNNSLLEGFDLEDYENVKKWIPQVLRFSKRIKEVVSSNSVTITGLRFEKVWGDHFTFYWLTGGSLESRNNDYVKIKGMDLDFMVKMLKSIYPKMDIIVV